MDGRKSDLLSVIMVVAVTLGVMVGNPGSAAAQGTICGNYGLPNGAEMHQGGIGVDANGKKIIWIEYQVPGAAGGSLTLPFDTIAVTCADPRIRGIVERAQEIDREVIQSSCKFVGDLLAGRVQLPPDKAAHYDRKYAEEWYRKTCVGTK